MSRPGQGTGGNGGSACSVPRWLNGHPVEVRALNEHSALVLFSPTTVKDAEADVSDTGTDTGDTGESPPAAVWYTTDGGLYVTIDDGSTWYLVTSSPSTAAPRGATRGYPSAPPAVATRSVSA